ncbi:DUF4224 domain-containing protein [Trinickia caryophylli]|uniref:DUF4224 domain-containing protein n=1 Tax=Trinickia caryophylli TaxID=28094 RepID=A0A1X7DYL7_TRICW|nr:DUF4224 domain-containing protein [Trinickia caryophylli]PMS14140.1 DUF4224 domain-containing protein [Trinickia caryophylli]TRX17838.1 DUF4224 domain-containing protein [Trinickia caryophylli]WQE11394.1 DUF4224 domain-containing protein [Trinickia caryophylli]SMF24017.1 protein of unknown function [Trinickia caryophylli]GLU32554.1 hypothetical protein Busp01_23960 [Trinickia caryophylli]
MSDYLSSHELADLIGCKPNQRLIMIRWLEARRWKFVVDRNGLPKVLRAYRDWKLGISEERPDARYDAGPNLDAFKKG